MPIRIKETGKRRGSKGFVYRIPIVEVDNVSEEEINRKLRDIYGTDKGQILVDNLPLAKYFQKVSSNKKFIDKLSKDESQMGRTLYKELQGDLAVKEAKEGIHLGVFRDTEKREDHPFYVSIDKNNITISPAVAMHGMTGKIHMMKLKFNKDRSKILSYGAVPCAQDTFLNLLSVLEKGYVGEPSKTVYGDNIQYKNKKGNRLSFNDKGKEGNSTWAIANKFGGITRGDAYSLEFVPNKFGGSLVNCTYGKPEDIVAVNVLISKDNSPQQKEEKMNYYKREIIDRFGVPVRFYLSEHNLESSAKQSGYNASIKGLEQKNRIFPKRQSLEQLASSATAVVAFIGSLVFTTSTFTGNVIGTLSTNTTNLIGVILFLIGITGTYFYVKKSKS